ncbi:EcsC family protein [Weissella halotolerans]|uniref:EcsC family protein n=1 Tax=Weissella halotolerans DSM 20190 TaxID=1123500 RepID=A0A0R2G751_9LACO|nr:EcsC family protein [Weissella halotolerans]KRN32525.1 hypothetical protein IV68_GL000880 [Weissella halotolerans DSM 20190]
MVTEKTKQSRLPITQDKMVETLDWMYEKTVSGIPGQKSVDELAADYLEKYDEETAITKLIQFQTAKAAVSGFVTGFGGVLTLPVALPANITSVLLFQMRMIAVIAKIRGYDLRNDQVQTVIYTTLVGTSVADLIKKSGIEFTNKLANGVVKKVPGTVLVKINQKVGFRFVTKFGQKGIVNLGKLVPVVGASFGGGIDYWTTKKIAMIAQNTFLNDGVALGNGIVLPKAINSVAEGSQLISDKIK